MAKSVTYILWLTIMLVASSSWAHTKSISMSGSYLDLLPTPAPVPFMTPDYFTKVYAIEALKAPPIKELAAKVLARALIAVGKSFSSKWAREHIFSKKYFCSENNFTDTIKRKPLACFY